MGSIVIIGSGLAGYTLAKEIRKLSADLSLHIITQDEGAFYSKPMLSNALAKGKTATTLASHNAEQMRVQLNATIWPHCEVTAIDTEGHTVTAGGKIIEYGKLVFATGAEPVQPPLQGDGVSQLCVVNNLEDYARFRARIECVQRIAIIGPGLIGCEFANDLLTAGKDVLVIGPAQTPLDRLLPPEAGRALQQALAEGGVQWRLGVTAQRVGRQDDALLISLSDGASVEADAILLAVGLRPNTALAQAAGIPVQRGIVVDRYLESRVGDVFALGDCAEVEGLVLPFVMPIMQAARAMAQTLSGKRTPVTYPAMPVVVKTPILPVVVSPPPAGSAGAWEVRGDKKNIRALYRNEQGRLLGFALTGNAVEDKQALTKELPAWLESA